jgi:hypothetical protein
MAVLESLSSGLAGALALTTVHEIARRNLDDAPRMDLLGQRGISRISEMAFDSQPSDEDLQEMSLVGDIAANSTYYSLVGAGPPTGAVVRGGLLGLAAGIGAVTLPGPLGLGSDPSNHSNATRVMTVAWYTLGGLVAGSVYKMLACTKTEQADRLAC